MRVLLIGFPLRMMNRSFYSLGLHYLRATALKDGFVLGRTRIAVKDFDLDEDDQGIIEYIHDQAPQLVGFSAFLWNMDKITRIANTLKGSPSGPLIAVGGPQVSYEPGEVLAENPCFDFVVKGEGELTFTELLRYLLGVGKDLGDIAGLAYRAGDGLCETTDRPVIMDLAQIPSPYLGNGFDLDSLNSRTKGRKPHGTLETIRGCPYSCEYCCWTSRKLRFFSFDRVRQEIEQSVSLGITDFLIADSDLSLNREVYRQLLPFLAKHYPQVKLHAPLRVENLEDADIEIYCAGPFEVLEIGLQTTNLQALKAISRHWDRKRFEERYFKLYRHPNRQAAIFVDLIVGLPNDSYLGFKNSLEYVVDTLGPDKVTIFWLTILRGSSLQLKMHEYGIRVEGRHISTVIENATYSKDDMLRSLALRKACVTIELTDRLIGPLFLRWLQSSTRLSRFQLIERIERWLGGIGRVPEQCERLNAAVMREWQDGFSGDVDPTLHGLVPDEPLAELRLSTLTVLRSLWCAFLKFLCADIEAATQPTEMYRVLDDYVTLAGGLVDSQKKHT